MATPKVTIISDDQRITQRLIQDIEFLNINLAEIIEKPREAYLCVSPNEPRVIIFVEPVEEVSVAQVINQVKKVNSTAPIIFLSKTTDYKALREIFRAGISDVIVYPDEMPEIEKTLDKAFHTLKTNRRKNERDKASVQKGKGTIFGVYSGKGGAGTSLVALNLANTMALKSSYKVLLIDLNLQFGGLQTMFNIDHDRNLGDLKPVMRELTESQIENVLYKVEESGLNVLLSPTSPEEAENFTGEDIELLLTSARLCFDVIILDLPKELNEISVSSLSNADHILYVVNLERPSIVRMQSVLDLLERYHLTKDDNVLLVVNKYSKSHDINLAELQRMSRFQVMGTITDNFKFLQGYINLGKPLLAEKKDKGKKGIPRDFVNLTTAALQKLEGE